MAGLRRIGASAMKNGKPLDRWRMFFKAPKLSSKANEGNRHHSNRRLVLLPHNKQIAAALTTKLSLRGVLDGHGGAKPSAHARRTGSSRRLQGCGEQSVLARISRCIAFKDDA